MPGGIAVTWKSVSLTQAEPSIHQQAFNHLPLENDWVKAGRVAFRAPLE